MCFSASVSFGVSAILLTTGAYTVNYALHNDHRYLALATFPLLFGIQQAFEGWLWLALATHDNTGTLISALGFLFFAYFLWPFYVPFAANRVEIDRQRQHIFRWFSLIGLAFGLSLYLPLLFQPDWLVVNIIHNSISYEPILIYEGIISRTSVRVFYAMIVAVPLLFTTVASLRRFGILILFSVVISAFFFFYAFVSIWCLFASLLSLYIVVILKNRSSGKS